MKKARKFYITRRQIQACRSTSSYKLRQKLNSIVHKRKIPKKKDQCVIQNASLAAPSYKIIKRSVDALISETTEGGNVARAERHTKLHQHARESKLCLNEAPKLPPSGIIR